MGWSKEARLAAAAARRRKGRHVSLLKDSAQLLNKIQGLAVGGSASHQGVTLRRTNSGYVAEHPAFERRVSSGSPVGLHAQLSRHLAHPGDPNKIQPRAWKEPPPPKGVRGEGKAGGYSADKAFGTNTALGRVGEVAFAKHTGGEILHPEGKGEQSPLDVLVDGYGFEVKAVSVQATEYKATPKKHEIAQKEQYAKQLGVKPALAIVVLDREAGRAHIYKRDGLATGKLSKNTGWDYIGTVSI